MKKFKIREAITIICMILCIVFLAGIISLNSDSSKYIYLISILTAGFIASAVLYYIFNNPGKMLSNILAMVIMILAFTYSKFHISTKLGYKSYTELSRYGTYTNLYRHAKLIYHKYMNKYTDVF